VSGGEGQRVRLARAMMRDVAELVILDEPFRGLDRHRRHEMLARARALWSGATLVCVTHDVAETSTFARVVIVDDGRIVEHGPPDELVRKDGSLYREMLLAEEKVRSEIWSDPRWRRLRVEDGKLAEAGAAGPR
jgi:ABC-type transport system involved in cytochrome bd biosynthesis fused ATPase/permease subunit